jgi:hypothetical protein
MYADIHDIPLTVVQQHYHLNQMTDGNPKSYLTVNNRSSLVQAIHLGHLTDT